MAKKPEADSDAEAGPLPALVQAETAAPPKRVVPLNVSRCMFGDFARNTHTAIVPAGTDFETVCRPEFWANVTRLAVGDIIQVSTDDRAWFAELFVLGKARNSATVAVLREPLQLVAAFKPEAGAKHFDVQFSGAHGKWRVIRLSDKNVVKDQFETQGEARKWLDQYERLVAA